MLPDRRDDRRGKVGSIQGGPYCRREKGSAGQQNTACLTAGQNAFCAGFGRSGGSDFAIAKTRPLRINSAAYRRANHYKRRPAYGQKLFPGLPRPLC